MKKIIWISLLGICLGATEVSAQSGYPMFSSGLGGGYVLQKGSIRRLGSGSVARMAPVKRIAPRKTIIRYEPNQIHLTEEQMKVLMEVIERVQEGKVRSLDIVGIAYDYNIIYHRETALGRIFQSYTPNLQPNFRHISGGGVVPSNADTVEFIEYK